MILKEQKYFDIISDALHSPEFATIVSRSINEQSQSTVTHFVNRSYENAMSHAKQFINKQIDEIRAQRKFQSSVFKELAEKVKSDTIELFKKGLLIGMYNFSITTENITEIQTKLSKIITKKEHQIFTYLAPSVIREASNKAVSMCNMLVRKENSNIKDKGYFCANYNTKDDIAERIFSQVENEIMDDITSALGDRIIEYSEEIYSHLSQLKELIKNDLASAYETAYISFCSTNRSYEESDADGGKYYVITENIRVEDPLERVLENKSNQIAKKTETYH